MAKIDSRSIDRGMTYIRDEFIEEAFEPMKSETKHGKVSLRTLMAAAIITALAFALAVGANAATGGKLYEMSIGRLVKTISLESGDNVTVYALSNENGLVGFIMEDASAPLDKQELDGGRYGFSISERQYSEGVEPDGEASGPKGTPYASYEVVLDDDGQPIDIKNYKRYDENGNVIAETHDD